MARRIKTQPINIPFFQTTEAMPDYTHDATALKP